MRRSVVSWALRSYSSGRRRAATGPPPRRRGVAGRLGPPRRRTRRGISVTQGLDGAVAAVNRAFLRGYPGEVARALEALPVAEAVGFLQAEEPLRAASPAP